MKESVFKRLGAILLTLSILFSLAGYLAKGTTYGPAVQMSIEASDYLKDQTKDLDVDEQ